MITDRALLKFYLRKTNYDKFRRFIPHTQIGQEAKLILHDIDAYQQINQQEVIDQAQFSSFFFTVCHYNFSLELREFYGKVLDHLFQESPDDHILGEQFVQHYAKLDIQEKLKIGLANDYSIDELLKIFEHAKTPTTANLNYTNMDIRNRINEPQRTSGLRWRLDCLNQGFGGLIKGDFLVVAGRPDSGKTSFLASEITYMAPQLEPGQRVLWFNNEWTGHVIRDRIYKAALNKTSEQIDADLEGTYHEYLEVMTEPGKIQVVDAIEASYKELTEAIKNCQPGLIIIDLLDKVQGFQQRGVVETSDAIFIRMYDWASNISCKYCPVIAVCQMSDLPPERGQYPAMRDLQGSKTAKQGSARAILMIGRNEDLNDNRRYLSAPKNKFQSFNFQYECMVDRKTGRFI